MRRRSSKKRSDTSSPAALPRLPVIYIDESLSQQILATALRSRRLEVRIRSDVFRPGVPDPEWLSHVGREGWIVLTKDKNIRRRQNEMIALINAGVRAFVLSGGEMTGDEQAALFVRLIPRIRKWVIEQPAPFVVRIDKLGGMELLWPTATRRRRR